MTCTCEDRGVIIVMHKSAGGTDHSGLNYVTKLCKWRYSDVCNKNIVYKHFCDEEIKMLFW